MNLRKEAIDRFCMIRLEGCQTTPCCLAHWRQIGLSGLGMKNFDLLGAWSCDSCHKKVDSVFRGDIEVQLDFARGVFRTQAELIREGKVFW